MILELFFLFGVGGGREAEEGGLVVLGMLDS